MARALAALAAVACASEVAAQLAGERDLEGYSFGSYLQEFGKNYHPKEAEHRQEIFKSNLELIRKHNKNPKKTWYAAVNRYTDWTHDEFRTRRVRTARPVMPETVRSLPPSAADVRDLPETVDWRQKTGVLTAVKDQGGCGSCWSFAAAETLESQLAIATGQPAPVLSEQQLVSCAPNPRHCGGTGGCGGSTAWLAFNYTQTAGLSLESEYPYQGATLTCDQSKVKPAAINSGWKQLAGNNYTALVHAVATIGPMAVSVAAGTVGWQIYGGGVYSGDSCGWDVDHLVQLVGYGTENGNAYWIVRNSWGPHWGESGFIRIARHGEGKEPCGLDTAPGDGSACEGDTKPIQYCGVCGILSDSSYPTGVRSTKSSSELVI